MQLSNLGVVEKKVLGGMMILADGEGVVKTTLNKLAETIGYKTSGGALSFALKILERDNFIIKKAQGLYKLLG